MERFQCSYTAFKQTGLKTKQSVTLKHPLEFSCNNKPIVCEPQLVQHIFTWNPQTEGDITEFHRKTGHINNITRLWAHPVGSFCADPCSWQQNKITLGNLVDYKDNYSSKYLTKRNKRTLCVQYHRHRSQHRRSWNPTGWTRYHGDRADICGAAHRRHHSHHCCWLGTVSEGSPNTKPLKVTIKLNQHKPQRLHRSQIKDTVCG